MADHTKPTDQELNSHPSLKSAWEEYLLVRKLTIGNDGTYVIQEWSPSDVLRYRRAKMNQQCK